MKAAALFFALVPVLALAEPATVVRPSPLMSEPATDATKVADLPANATVECSPLLGPQLMTVIKELAAGKQVPRRVITQESLFTRDNAAAELPHRAY